MYLKLHARTLRRPGDNPAYRLPSKPQVVVACKSVPARELVETILATEFGDANLTDGTTLADVGILATNFNKTGEDFGWSDADFTWDGDVALADLGILAENFGPNGPISQAEFEDAVADLLGASVADLVPEPATAVLLSLLGLMMLRRAARHSRV